MSYNIHVLIWKKNSRDLFTCNSCVWWNLPGMKVLVCIAYIFASIQIYTIIQNIQGIPKLIYWTLHIVISLANREYSSMNEKKKAAKSELSSFLQICTIYFEINTGELSLAIPFIFRAISGMAAVAFDYPNKIILLEVV